jgi:hypothetical protein
MMRLRSTLLAALLLLVACGPRTVGPRGDRNFISMEEVQASGRADAYAAVESLRPLWLRSRGPTSITQGQQSVQVYLDNTLMGGLDQLRLIPAHNIASMRYFDGPEATQRWGLNHGLGAIVVSTRGEARD